MRSQFKVYLKITVDVTSWNQLSWISASITVWMANKWLLPYLSFEALLEAISSTTEQRLRPSGRVNEFCRLSNVCKRLTVLQSSGFQRSSPGLLPLPSLLSKNYWGLGVPREFKRSSGSYVQMVEFSPSGAGSDFCESERRFRQLWNFCTKIKREFCPDGAIIALLQAVGFSIWVWE